MTRITMKYDTYQFFRFIGAEESENYHSVLFCLPISYGGVLLIWICNASN
jgi:hypothetical protein